LAEDRPAIFDDPTDPVGGDASGTVTVVVWQDSQCPFCKRLTADLNRLIAENSGVRIV
jgi:protein-disulfide isomerase